MELHGRKQSQEMESVRWKLDNAPYESPEPDTPEFFHSMSPYLALKAVCLVSTCCNRKGHKFTHPLLPLPENVFGVHFPASRVPPHIHCLTLEINGDKIPVVSNIISFFGGIPRASGVIRPSWYHSAFDLPTIMRRGLQALF